MLVAITGGIGCGKSVVSRLLCTMGYEVYDCDSHAKRLMLNDNNLRAGLIELFGKETYFPDGSLNRTHVSAYLFGNAEMLEKMNDLIHPSVALDLLDTYTKRQHELFFFESAVLYESRFDEKVHPNCVISISAPLNLRIERTIKRDNAQRDNVEKRIGSQMPQEEKDQRADIVILNDDRNSLILQVEKALRLLECKTF